MRAPIRPITRLRFERLRRNISQTALAERSRVPQHTISRIEIGRVRPSDEELTALSQVLGVPPQHLLDPIRIKDDPGEPTTVIIEGAIRG